MANDKPNLAQRMLQVMEKVSTVTKEEKLVNNQYRFVSHDAVAKLIHQAFVEARIVMYTNVEQLDVREIIITNFQGKKSEATHTTVHLQVTYVNPDNPEDTITGIAVGSGIDTQDKGIGKAVSYALKYKLQKDFLLQGGEDVERDVDYDVTPSQPAAPPAVEPGPPSQPSPPPQPTADSSPPATPPPPSAPPKNDVTARIAEIGELAKRFGLTNNDLKAYAKGKPARNMTVEELDGMIAAMKQDANNKHALAQNLPPLTQMYKNIQGHLQTLGRTDQELEDIIPMVASGKNKLDNLEPVEVYKVEQLLNQYVLAEQAKKGN